MKSDVLAAICLVWYFFIITVCTVGVFQMYIYSLETLTKCPDDELEYDAIHRSLNHQSLPVSQTPLMSLSYVPSRGLSPISTNVWLQLSVRHTLSRN